MVVAYHDKIDTDEVDAVTVPSRATPPAKGMNSFCIIVYSNLALCLVCLIIFYTVFKQYFHTFCIIFLSKIGAGGCLKT